MVEELYIDGIGMVKITNWDQFVRQLLFLIGEEITTRIDKEATKMRLWDTGHFIRNIGQPGPRIELGPGGAKLILENSAPYAEYLEFGTFAFGEKYGLDSFPKIPFPKKKDLSRAAAARFPKGMQPFAPYRRILYSEAQMSSVLKAVARGAS